MLEKLNLLRKTSEISRIVLSYPADLAGPLRITFGSSSIILCFSLLPLGHYLQRAVNRQPGYRPGDQEVVLRLHILLEAF